MWRLECLSVVVLWNLQHHIVKCTTRGTDDVRHAYDIHVAPYFLVACGRGRRHHQCGQLRRGHGEPRQHLDNTVCWISWFLMFVFKRQRDCSFHSVMSLVVLVFTPPVPPPMFLVAQSALQNVVSRRCVSQLRYCPRHHGKEREAREV